MGRKGIRQVFSMLRTVMVTDVAEVVAPSGHMASGEVKLGIEEFFYVIREWRSEK